MDSRTLELVLGLDDAEDPDALRLRAARELGLSPDQVDQVPEPRLLRRSIDARRGRVKIRWLVGLDRTPEPDLGGPRPREVGGQRTVAIVGAGPAGLFCAYELARHGVPAVVVDRGKKVQPRRRSLQQLNTRGAVDPDSNYCFGEGGAGTYSDGKLYTRSHKRGDVRDVIEILALHGAPDRILYDARPHIGSNLLPKVVTAMRERLEDVGVEFRFDSRVTDFDVADRAVRGVELAGDGGRLGADAVVVATGHSARDVFDIATRAGVALEAKPFALGVRIEHPQPLINEQQYGRAAGHPKLPAAAYRLAHQARGRGVFTFCMCPGGWIVPAATETDGLVVNGMSLSRRDSPFANSGLVVAVEPEDWARAGYTGHMGGVDLQRAVERASFEAGGGALRAPATRASDFAAGRASSSVPDTSYRPGLAAGDVGEVLDRCGLDLADRLREAIRAFGGRMRSYDSSEAVLVAAESRTSAPVRMPRDPDSLESPDLAGLYPCGEGAGYAGGIVSAALDGIRVARAICRAWGVAPATRP